MKNKTSDDNLSMEKITFMAPPSLVAEARRAAFADDRDLSSICRLALRKFLHLGRFEDRPRGRPKGSKTTPVKVL